MAGVIRPGSFRPSAGGSPSRSSYITVKGGEQFLALSKQLKAVDANLRREMSKEIREAAKPLIAASRREARARLPKRGGLNELVAKTPQRVQIRTGPKTAGVRIVVGQSNSGARATNRGMVRHPVFPDKSTPRESWTWVTQPVPKGWFDDTMADQAPKIRWQIIALMNRIANDVVRGVGRAS